MTRISYAQNFEDVILWRALKGVANGFYIDVGAWSHELDSVTRLFYEEGWHGINIEPNPPFHAELLERRPRDINICKAVSDQPGNTQINFFNNPGISTLDNRVASIHEAAGFTLTKRLVEVTTLDAIWQENVDEMQQVHFLKIDVEGLEREVLLGNSWKIHRPWVVVVEATLPMSEIQSYDAWEELLLSNEYRFAYADGINRFYVADEHIELLPAFEFPPNIFDDFIVRKHHVALEQSAERAIKLKTLEDDYSQAIERVSAIEHSWSWRITAPLRCMQDSLLRSGQKLAGAKSLFVNILTIPIRHMLSWLIELSARYPRFKSSLTQKLGISAEFEYRLFEVARAHGLVGGSHDGSATGIMRESGSHGDIAHTRITSADYFELHIPQRVCEIYGLNIDFELIERIREELTIPYEQYAETGIEQAIVHAYLALLYRHPSSQDTALLAQKIRRSSSFDVLFEKILKSPEFDIRGYKRVAG